MFSVTYLADAQRKAGTPRGLGLGSPRRMALAQRYLMQTTQAINKCNKYVLN
jgi:hypothetical protein